MLTASLTALLCLHDLQEQAETLGVNFEAPLREYVRMVKSAKAVMQDRSTALNALQDARGEVDAKRTKLAKLRGTPGIKVPPAPCSPLPDLPPVCVADMCCPSLALCAS